jgi:hypothetical protein
MGVVQRGQVAQVVERSPEKAGVGGSTPSLATINSKQLTPGFHFPYYPQFTRSCPHYCTQPVTGAALCGFLTESGSAAFLPRNSNSKNIPCASSLSSVTAFA